MVPKSRYVIAFAMTAVSVGAWLYWRGVGEQQADAMSREPAAQSGTTAISSGRPGAFEAGDVWDSKVADGRAAAGPDDRTNSQVDRTRSTAPTATGELNSGANSQAASSETDGLSVPEGAPFPIAESIEKQCASGNDLDWDCAEVQRALKIVEDETRDTRWASSMESRIRAAVGAAPGVNIRALACRATVCVVETDGALLLSNVWTPLHQDLLDAGYIRARERTGNREETIRVQLWTFKRRR